MPGKKWRRSVCGSKQGRSHIADGIECQDYVSVCDNSEYTIAALADGVGSKALSRVAATEAVKETIRWFMSNAADLGDIEQPGEGAYKIRSLLLPELRARIEQRARDDGQDVRDMDCNLAFVFIRKHLRDEDRVYYGVLGDCAVCVVGEGDRMYTVCGAQPGNSATDSVMYLPSEQNFKIYHSYMDREGIRGFLLTSDGLEYKAYVKGSNYVYNGAQDYYNAIFAPNPEQEIMQLFQKLQQNPFYSDDLSVAVLSRDEDVRVFRADPNWLCQCGQRNNIHNQRCSNCKIEFISLYRGVQDEFKGNKFEYFLELNQHPNDEYTLLGLGPGIEPSKKEPPKRPAAPVKQEKSVVKQKKTSVKQEKPAVKPENPNKETTARDLEAQMLDARNHETGMERIEKKSLLLTILSGAAVVLILINLLLTGMGLINGRKTRAMKEELSGQLQEVQKGIQDVYYSMQAMEDSEETAESHMLRLADGSVYYGETSDGVPHGYGFVESEGYIASGQFINGVKNGTFLIRSREDPQELTVVSYVMGDMIGESRKAVYLSERVDMLASITVTSELDVYSDHSQNRAESRVIPSDTMIYLTGEYYCKNSGLGGKTELWINICETDGQQGWCRAADLGMFDR